MIKRITLLGLFATVFFLMAYIPSPVVGGDSGQRQNTSSSDINALQNERDRLSSQLGQVQNELNNAKLTISGLEHTIATQRLNSEAMNRAMDDFYAISESFPLAVTNIELGSMRSSGNYNIPFGARLTANQIYYLSPRITYNGYAISTIKLNIRLINNEGLIKGDIAVGGSSNYTDTFRCEKGTGLMRIMSSWGNDEGTYYKAGNWRIEFWYGDKCLGAKNFTIY